MGSTRKAFELDSAMVGESYPPYVIAEISGNHNGDKDRALALIRMARDSGAHAVKLQTYTPDTITLDHDGPGFLIDSGPWEGRNLYELYEEAHTPWEWHGDLFDYAKDLGITCFSSPFDLTAIDFLETLGAPAYKIASFEIVDVGLIARAAQTGKPLIISTGMASDEDISEALAVARKNGAMNIVLLHCVSGYPTPVNEARLSRIVHLRNQFDVLVGLSDHTLGEAVPIAGVALGATMIEKHVTLARADGGPDAGFSLEPDELEHLCSRAAEAFAAVSGDHTVGLAGSEEPNAIFRRSLYAVQDIGPGEVFTADNVKSIRPGFGLPPKYLSVVLGRKAQFAISRGTPLTKGVVEGLE